MLASHALTLAVPGVAVLAAVVLACVLLTPRARRRLAAVALPLAAAGGIAAAVLAAETPFGIGDGTVPSLVGRPSCAAEAALEARGLRWRYAGGGDATGAATACASGHGGGDGGLLDPVTRQAPRPGTRVGAGAVVIIESRCSAPSRDGACG